MRGSVVAKSAPSPAAKKRTASNNISQLPKPKKKTPKLDEYIRKDDQAELFTHSMESQGRHPHDVLVAAASAIRTHEPWFMPMSNFVAGSDGTYEYPNPPEMSHKLILEFLREPLEKSKERPCINLDRDPSEQYEQGLMRCVAHRLSEKQLGAGKGFRLREMLFDDADKQPELNVPDLCYLCHLYVSLCDALRQRDKTAERNRPDMRDKPEETVVIINRFRVMVNQIGEYDRDKMLVSDKIGLGIWGYFPLFNENDYTAVARKPGAPAHFLESPNLLFRLTPAASQTTGSSSLAPTSTQCNPTRATL